MDAGLSNHLFDSPSSVAIDHLPGRLERDPDRFDPLPDYGTLRLETALWVRELEADAPEAELRADLGRELLLMEPLIERSVLLETPNLAGMGVRAWDRSPLSIDGADAHLEVATPERRARRMMRGTSLEALVEEEPVVRSSEAAVDAGAFARTADIVEALQRVRRAASVLPEGAPEPIGAGLERLRDTLRRRLAAERRHDAGIDAALSIAKLADTALPETLRSRAALAQAAEIQDHAGQVVRVDRPRENPYDAAIESVVAAERHASAPTWSDADADRVAELRRHIATQARRATTAKGDAAARAVEKTRRLLAREVALTGGRPGAPLPARDGADADYEAARSIDTLAVRRALAARPGTAPRPSADRGVTPRTDLPELPILSSRGPKARVVGYLAAGERLPPLGPGDADHIRVAVPGRREAGWIARAWLDTGRVARFPWPSRLEAPDVIARTVGPRPPQLAPRPSALAEAAPSDLTLARDPTGAAAPPVRSELRSEPAGPPLSIGRVRVEGLSGPGADAARAVLDAALATLPDVLSDRLERDPALAERLSAADVRVGDLRVPLEVRASGGDPRARGRIAAERIADALLDRARHSSPSSRRDSRR